MNFSRTRSTLQVVVALLCVLFPVAIFAASDVVTVGTVNATGTSVDVPVYIRDVSGTSLGKDQPAGSKIQSYSIKVTYSPSSAVQSVSFSRAGITSSLNPTSEFKPTTSNSVSLLDTFSESTDPIPFTLNASAPGNQVAHLVFTLSGSAPPGSAITLTLDPSLTQLTDSGGTAATKETTANGGLTLVNGQINVPALTLSLSPASRTIAPGNDGNLTALLSGVTPVDVTVNLSSSNTSVATAPASVVIAAGTSAIAFKVDAIALGTARITGTSGALSASSTITVANAPPVCTAPPAVSITAPSSANTGVPYALSWPAAINGTEYVLEESTDEGFSAPLTQTFTGLTASFTHGTAGVRYYYRLRARNHAATCDLYSDYSPVVSVLITDAPLPVTRVLTVVGSLQGSFGSFFRTSLRLYNPHASAVAGRIVFHRAGTSGSASDPTLAFTLAPGKTLSYADILPAMGLNGLGSVDLVADASSPYPIAAGRVFNDAGALGTSGLGLEALPLGDALQTGQTGVLLAPDDVAHFRLNIGVRTLTAGAAMTITVRDKDGATVKTLTASYEPTFFNQVASAVLLEGYALTGGETISFTMTSGSAFIYGSTTDNVTNDPTVLFAQPVE
jgi:hypothetical protein